MVNFLGIILIVIGILLIFIYPKIIRWAMFIVVFYLSVTYSWYFSIIYVPLLLIMYYYKRLERKNG